MGVMTQMVCLPAITERTVGEQSTGRRGMAAPRLSSAAQLRYMLQWFEEWSELQRQDFLPILADKLAGSAPDADTSIPAATLNGVVSSMAAVSCHSKPMSLFQCRIKLFNEWYPSWSAEERDRLVQGATDVDADFGSRLQEALVAALSTRSPSATATAAAALAHNGLANGLDADGDVAADAAESSPPAPAAAAAGDEGESGGAPEPDDRPQGNLPENTMTLEIAATS